MPNRITGMYSGMDTESLIQDLMHARRKKNEKLTKNQTKMEWKQEKWKELDKKINSFFSKAVSNLRWSTSFQKKATTVSAPNAVSVITSDKAMNSVQNLSIKELASSGYLTGGKINASGSTTLSELGVSGDGSFSVTVNGEKKNVSFSADTTVSEVVSKLNSAGVTASFDETNKRIFIGAKASGEDNDFSITADDANGTLAMKSLGINVDIVAGSKEAKEYAALKGLSDLMQNSATATDVLDSGNAEAISRLTALAQKNYDAKVSKLNANISEANATIEAAKKRIEELTPQKDNATLTEEDIAAIDKEIAEQEEKIASNEERLASNTSELDALTEGKLEGDTASWSDALSTLKSQVEVASKVDIKDKASATEDGPVRINGKNAEIELNGAKFTSSSNVISVNGLTFTALAKADNITVTTQDDTNGIYDMVKSFIKEYNALINEIDSLYNADSTKVEPLTDEERDAVTDTEADKLEKQVRDALLRKDENLGSVFNGLREVMNQGFKVGDKTLYLADFGISTGSYFATAVGERNAFHIDGDVDDDTTAGNQDLLKNLIATDSDSVVSFFTQLGQALYTKMSDLSKSSDYSSFGKFYDDKKMTTDLADYKERIAKAEAELTAYEDKMYAKFSAMEVALSKMQSKTSYLSGLFTQ